MYITQGLHRSLQQRADEIAIVDGDRHFTFAELADRVARFASALRELGVQRGDRVAILSLNSGWYHEYYLAVPWADAMVNPINIRWTATEIAYALTDSGTEVLIVDATFAPLVPAIKQQYEGLRTVIFAGAGPAPEGTLSYDDLVAAASPIPDARRGGGELAGLFYTGGTTGFPKGVMLSHANLLTSAYGALSTGMLCTPGGRVLHTAPMFHAADFAMWNAATISGNTHITVPNFEPVSVMRAIAEHQIADILLVPTMIQMLVDHPALKEYELGSLQRVMYGGSGISAAVLGRAMRALPAAQFTQAYGLTELSPIATMLLPQDHVLEGEKSIRLTSGGRAAPHAEVLIVDPEDNEVPRRTVGEIIVGGGHVTRGYWNKPDETAQAIRNGWMHTGDLGWMDEEGFVFVVDRLKDMIVTGGENVYSTEVENAVATHPAVANVAVIGLPDERWGERVHAVVVCHPGQAVTLEELHAHARERIANYKLPRSADFVEALPISGAGKVLKRELRAAHVPVS